MLLYLFIWVLVFFILLSMGISLSRLLDLLFKTKCHFSMPEYFYSGFLIISLLAGYFSLFIPVGNALLLILAIASVISILMNHEIILQTIKSSIAAFRINRNEAVVMIIIVVFVLATISNIITWGDTGLYHTQAIQWIRKYPVVPGLGNIHGRLAFNSMFFVISALFTIEFRDSVIYPLNSLCFIILVLQLFQYYIIGKEEKSIWKMLFHGLLILYSLLMLAPMLNSPSPDVICSIIVIFVFTYLFNYALQRKEISGQRFLIITIAIFSCAGFKVSAVFLSVALFFFFNKGNLFRRGLTSIIVGIVVLAPFLIRNYYLSGYALYPYPGIDIFNVDWKIPYPETLSMKEEIEGWAKMSKALPYPEVIKAGFTQWIRPWFLDMNFNNKVLIITNTLSIFTLVLMIIRRNFMLAGIQMLIFANIIFWLVTAPDTRFLYGFLFVGLSFTIAYLIDNIGHVTGKDIRKLVKPVLFILLIIILLRRVNKPADTFANPSYWLTPASYQTAETKTFDSGFTYRVSVPEGDNCFNAEIPCVPYELKNIVLRGKTLKEGFKVEISH